MLCLQSLVDLNLEKTDTRIMPMEESIFGVYYEENIVKEYFNEFFQGEEIGVSIICIYIRYLFEKLLCPRNLTRQFSFLSPHRVSMVLIEKDPKPVEEYMVAELMKTKDLQKLFFAPLYFDKYGDWVLVVIDAVSEIVYYLDPLLGDPNSHPNMKKFLNTVLQKFRSLRGARVQRSKLNNISWIRIQCPRQRNSIDCGYFVMRFMKEIVISNKIEIPVSYFDDF
ncbi:ubiquitin-specific protease [Trifolium repens]|nr:ubiquitin-specific protease [Trifolium repens]